MAPTFQSRDDLRLQAEQTRAELAAIVDYSRDAIVGRTLDGVVTRWNRGAERLFGYSRDEILGRSTLSWLPTDTLQHLRQNLERIKRGEPIDSYESVHVDKQGKPVHVLITSSPVLDDRGDIIGSVSIIHDISERKRAYDEIRALHELNVAITSTLDLHAILHILLEKIEVAFPYAVSHIRLKNKSTGELEAVACRNIDARRWTSETQKARGTMQNHILKSKRPVMVPDLQAGNPSQGLRFWVESGMASFLGVPLIVKETTIGVLSLLTREKHDFSDSELRFMEALARLASIAIYNCQLYEESKTLVETLGANEKQIRKLVVAQFTARDEEQKRIASLLHDESSQLLAAIHISLGALTRDLPAASSGEVATIKSMLNQIEERLRNLSHELHPAMLDHLGLIPSLEFLSRQVTQRYGIQVKMDAAVTGRLPARLELTLYRVVQEALSNVTRHAQARQVEVRLAHAGDLIRCSVQDNGVGFDTDKVLRPAQMGQQGLGLALARERVEAIGGFFQVDSTLGKGTSLSVLIPKDKNNGREFASR